MERQEVTSTSIRSVGYDREDEILEIEFDSGQVYDYYHIPEEVYQAFLDAESLGRYFQENIRDIFDYQKQ